MRLLSSPGRVALVVLAAICSTALLPVASASAASSLGCADDATGTQDLSSWVPEMLEATNAHRASKGLVALHLDPVLTRASVWKSRDMGRRNYFEHSDQALPGESSRTPWERLAACGWTKGGSRAENIAAGQQSGRAFITAWINSPGHRANIENASLRYVGFGVVRVTGSRYGTYATQMFASVSSGETTTPPPPQPPAAPTVTQLSFAYEGTAKTVCPTSGSGVTYLVDAVQGQVDATTSGSCVLVAPRAGIGGVTATVDYRARNASTGLTSPVTRMTVTVADAPPPPLPPPTPTPPPPPPPTPTPTPTPTITQLAFDYQAPTQTVCPPSGSDASYVLDTVEGWVVAGITEAGCLRVSPVTGKGGVTAYVTYHARHAQGGTSPTVRMTVTVAAAPAPEPTPTPDPEPTPTPDPIPDSVPTPDPMPTPDPTLPAPTEPTPAPPVTGPTTGSTPKPNQWRGTSIRTERYRCRGTRALKGWCWRIVVIGRLVASNGTPVRGARVTARHERMRTTRITTTSRLGSFRLVIDLRPPRTGTSAWLRAATRNWRLTGPTADAMVLARR